MAEEIRTEKVGGWWPFRKRKQPPRRFHHGGHEFAAFPSGIVMLVDKVDHAVWWTGRTGDDWWVNSRLGVRIVARGLTDNLDSALDLIIDMTHGVATRRARDARAALAEVDAITARPVPTRPDPSLTERTPKETP